jgi:hypothetical protein
LISDAEAKGKSPLKKMENDLFNCERRNNSKQNLNHIPLEDKEAQEWLKSRKIDKHLDLDFLPRNLVYNLGDLAESNKQMESVL